MMMMTMIMSMPEVGTLKIMIIMTMIIMMMIMMMMMIAEDWHLKLVLFNRSGFEHNLFS